MSPSVGCDPPAAGAAPVPLRGTRVHNVQIFTQHKDGHAVTDEEV